MAKLVLRGGRLIDSTGRQPVESSAVVVDGSRIAFVGSSSDLGKVDGATVVDLAGLTIMPGLINAHCHLTLNGDDEPYETKVPKLARLHDTMLTLMAAEQAKKNLDNGITTVRDLHPSSGGTEFQVLSLRDAIKAGTVLGSRIVCTGKCLVMAGGHGSHWISRECSGVEDCRRGAREVLKTGADFIKIMAAAGWGPILGKPATWAKLLTAEEMAAAVEIAHRAGKPAAAHSHGVQSISDVLDAGIDSVEHGSGLTDELVERMVKQGTYLVPTLTSYDTFVRGGVTATASEEKIRDAQGVIERHRPGIAKAIQAGVKIAAGTDAGFQRLPHGELVSELQIYRTLGMSAHDAIIAATKTAANLLQIGDLVGTVEPNKVADLLVVDGDPLFDLESLRNIRLVMKEGKIYRNELQTRVAAVA